MAWLITGGNGYVGKHLVQSLPETIRNNCFFPGRQDLDLCNWNSVKQYFEAHSIQRIVHLAASLDNDPKSLFESNIYGLFLLLDASRIFRVEHFLMVSTNNVYGTGKNNFKENDFYCPDPENRYGISKMYGEMAVQMLLEKSGIPYAIVRLGDVFGPKQKVGALLKAVVGNILAQQSQKLYGDGDRTRDYIYVDDVAYGLRFVMENCLQGIYNLATGTGTNVREIIATAERISECKEKTICVPVEREDHSRVVLDVSKLATAGFRANTSFEQGLRAIIKEERKNEQ